MHPAALSFATHVVRTIRPPRRVLEMGSRNVNGSVRPLFAGAAYVGLDLLPGPGVDVVADAATWPGDGKLFDCVVSTEVLEHAPGAARICANAHRLLTPGGVLILTMAGEGRPPHSALDGGELRPGEFYRNVPRPMLAGWLAAFVVRLIDAASHGGDIYALAVKGDR